MLEIPNQSLVLTRVQATTRQIEAAIEEMWAIVIKVTGPHASGEIPSNRREQNPNEPGNAI